MKQQARNLTDVFDGFLHGKWKLIHDRDPLFSEHGIASLVREELQRTLRGLLPCGGASGAPELIE